MRPASNTSLDLEQVATTPARPAVSPGIASTSSFVDQGSPRQAGGCSGPIHIRALRPIAYRVAPCAGFILHPREEIQAPQDRAEEWIRMGLAERIG